MYLFFPYLQVREAVGKSSVGLELVKRMVAAVADKHVAKPLLASIGALTGSVLDHVPTGITAGCTQGPVIFRTAMKMTPFDG